MSSPYDHNRDFNVWARNEEPDDAISLVQPRKHVFEIVAARFSYDLDVLLAPLVREGGAITRHYHPVTGVETFFVDGAMRLRIGSPYSEPAGYVPARRPGEFATLTFKRTVERFEKPK